MRRLIIIIAVSAILLLVLLVVWIGPRIEPSPQISQHRARWERANISDYTFTIDTGCFGPCTNGKPVTIIVRGGEPVGTPYPPDERRSKWAPKTIEAVFDRIEELKGADGFSVTYDKRYGYPVRGTFDPVRNATDDEWGFTITSFQPSNPA